MALSTEPCPNRALQAAQVLRHFNSAMQVDIQTPRWASIHSVSVLCNAGPLFLYLRPISAGRHRGHDTSAPHQLHRLLVGFVCDSQCGRICGSVAIVPVFIPDLIFTMNKEKEKFTLGEGSSGERSGPCFQDPLLLAAFLGRGLVPVSQIQYFPRTALGVLGPVS